MGSKARIVMSVNRGIGVLPAAVDERFYSRVATAGIEIASQQLWQRDRQCLASGGEHGPQRSAPSGQYDQSACSRFEAVCLSCDR